MGFASGKASIIEAIENKSLVISVEDGKVVFSGKTYCHKDWLKHEFDHIRFDAENKCWYMELDKMYSREFNLLENICPDVCEWAGWQGVKMSFKVNGRVYIAER